jgi:adenylate kinase family enzyme
MLQKELGMPVIAADDLIKKNPQIFQQNKIRALHGIDAHLDPAMNGLVEKALQSADLSKGVVLDGYPASKTQGDFLSGLREKLNLARVTVIHLAAPDAVVRSRLADQAGRDVEQELKDYHREFDFMRQYFPQADIRTVDATKAVEDVAKDIREMVQGSRK